MADQAATDAGKGARVLGFFVFQLGAGVILDSTAHAWGAAVVIVGLVTFAWGIAQHAGSTSKPAIADDGSGEESTTC